MLCIQSKKRYVKAWWSSGRACFLHGRGPRFKSQPSWLFFLNICVYYYISSWPETLRLLLAGKSGCDIHRYYFLQCIFKNSLNNPKVLTPNPSLSPKLLSFSSVSFWENSPCGSQKANENEAGKKRGPYIIWLLFLPVISTRKLPNLSHKTPKLELKEQKRHRLPKIQRK